MKTKIAAVLKRWKRFFMKEEGPCAVVELELTEEDKAEMNLFNQMVGASVIKVDKSKLGPQDAFVMSD